MLNGRTSEPFSGDDILLQAAEITAATLVSRDSDRSISPCQVSCANSEARKVRCEDAEN